MTAFKPIREIKSYTMKIDALPATIFPLLCPVREYEWIEPWSCDMVFSESGVAEKMRCSGRILRPRAVGKLGSCAGMKKIGPSSSFVLCPIARSTGWMYH